MGIVLHSLFCLVLLFVPVLAKYRNVTIDDTDPSIHYAGNWSRCPVTPGAAYQGTRSCTGDNDTSATFTFTGVAIYYIAPLIPTVVTYLALDSEQPILINLTENGNQTVGWAVMWGKSGLNNGPHTLVNYGRNSSPTVTYPTGASIAGEVDGFIYTVVEQDHSVAEIAGGTVAGVVALVAAGAGYIFGPHLADWLRQLAFVTFGWLLFRGRRFAFVSDVPNETQITLFLTLTPRLPDGTGDGDNTLLRWKVLHIGPGRRQEVVHLPSRGRTCDPGIVPCALEANENGYRPGEIALKAASDYKLNGTTYEWATSDRPGISVVNRAPHDVLFGLATSSDEGSANPFFTFTVPSNVSQEFDGSIYIHAFRSTGVEPGSRQDFSQPDFLANRITEEDGLEVAQLGPTTYWYVYQSGDRLKVKIGRSQRDIKRYKHQLELGNL